jgi:hypothetical protein
MAAINWKRAGNFACVAAREMVMWPFSRGSRKASRALRLTSANSSKNNTPLCANDISPGRGGVPPVILHINCKQEQYEHIKCNQGI